MNDMTVQEQATQINSEKILNNAIVIANIVELTSNVIIRIAGKDIADSLNNNSLSKTVINNLIANRIKERILA